MEVLLRLKSKSSNEMVFSRSDAGCKHTSHVAREFASDCKNAEVRSIKFHDLRHTYATQFMAKGGLLHVLSAILGHSTITTTMRYAHFIPEQVKAAAQTISFNVPKLGNVVELNKRRADIKINGQEVVSGS